MKSVLFDTLKDSSFPFVHVIAPYGKGKSRLLVVLCEITPYGFYAIDIKSAPLKRVSELYQINLFVDEKGQMDADTEAVINAKFNRNSIVLNASKEIQSGFSSIIGYFIYGPMILAGRTPFADDAIESKSLQINMDFEMTREDIPRKIKGEIFDRFTAQALQIRNKLLQFRIKWHDKINEVRPGDFLKIYEDKTEPRLFEVISFFEDLIEIMPEIKPEIEQVLKDQILRNVEVAADTPNGIVATTLLGKIDTGEDQVVYTINGHNYTGIRLASIYDELGENYKQRAGRILSALGIKTDRPRVDTTRKGKNGEEEIIKKRVSAVRIPGEKKINELRSRYDAEFVKSNLSSISQVQQAKLDEQDEQDEHYGNTPHENEEKSQGNKENTGSTGDSKPNIPDDLNSELPSGYSTLLQSKNNEENIDDKNARASANSKAQEAKDNEKEKGYSNFKRPNRPNRPGINADPANSATQNEKTDAPTVKPDREEKYPTLHDKVIAEGMDKNPIPYANVDTVLKTLKEYGFEVMEYEPALYGPQDTWKAQLKGPFDMFTTEQQEALLSGFKIISTGDVFNKATWIQFRVRTDNKPPAGPEKPEKPAGNDDDKHSDGIDASTTSDGIETTIMAVLRDIVKMTNAKRITVSDVRNAWPINAKIVAPSHSDLYERILPAMAMEGLIYFANEMIEIPGGGQK